MIFRALLSGIRWENIVRMLGLRERFKGIGDGRIEGYRYMVMQRGDEILIVLPDYQPQEKCLEAAKRILQKLAPKAKVRMVKMGHASSHCNHCLEPTPLPYRCHRCNGWYCENHRLPEQHNCPGGKEREEKIVEPVTPKKRKKRKKKRKKEILVAEVPCG